MKHCERCNIVHVNLECPLCAAKATIEKMRFKEVVYQKPHKQNLKKILAVQRFEERKKKEEGK